MFILGHGLKDYDLWQLEGIKTDYLGGLPQTGIIKIHHDQELKQGEDLIVNGLYARSKSGTKLTLEDPTGEPLDSLVLSGNSEESFRLETQLKAKGNYLYHLKETDSLGIVISNDPIPISVTEKQALKLLMINAFPTFESKYLKNYLAGLGHQITVRSRLTKGRYKYEYFNQSGRTPIDFSQKSLEVFDLVIIDLASLRGLSRSDQNALKNGIRLDGLGLFIQPEAGLFTRSAPLMDISFERKNRFSTKLRQWPTRPINVFGFDFKESNNFETIIASEDASLAGYVRSENGRIGTSLFQNTYELILSGHSETYRHIWTKTIESLSKREKKSTAWQASERIAYQNEPFEFQLRSSESVPKIQYSEGYQIPMMQDIDERQLWTGTVIPKKIGWQHLSLAQDSSAVHHFYVADSTSWNAATNFEMTKSNRRRFQSENIAEVATTTYLKIIDPLWFFIIFIVCIGYLWLQPKL